MTLVQNPSQRNMPVVILGVLAFILFLLMMARVPLPIINTDRAAFFAIAALGFGMCVLGSNYTIQVDGARSVPVFFGTLFGILTGALIVATLFNIRLPLITDDRAALIALAMLIFVKFFITNFRRMYLNA